MARPSEHLRLNLPPPPLATARILIAACHPQRLGVLGRAVRERGYTRVDTVLAPADALALAGTRPPDVVILDLVVPGFDAADVMPRLAAAPDPHDRPAILAVVPAQDATTRRRVLEVGARDAISHPFHPVEFGLRLDLLAETRLLHRTLAEHNRALEAIVRLRTRELEETRFELLHRLARAAEYRDDESGDHPRRVGDLARQLALALGVEEPDAEVIGLAATLHDIGKVGIPDAVLLKPGDLDEAELAVMQLHTVIGAEILSGSHDPLLVVAERIARSHHERWDGTGYPAGLAGTAIPREGRITAVADVFDVVTHPRRLGRVLTQDEALALIASGAGRQFDPGVVNALLGICRSQALVA